jgi:predicted ATP-dependent serine protease
MTIGKLASEVKPEKVNWLWQDRIALGKLCVIDGDPGLGKSLLTLDVAARVSANNQSPDETSLIPGSVLIFNAEDDIADTIVPRLVAAGATLDRIRVVSTIGEGKDKRLPDLTKDIGVILGAASEMDAVLIVIDPLMPYLPPTVNAHRDQHVRRVLFGLAEVAHQSKAAIVLVRHLNKMSSEPNPIY